jgi:formate dehydrogenase accessory protein FdhD
LKRHLPARRRVRIEINGILAGAPLVVPDAVQEFAIGWAFSQRFLSSHAELGKVSSTASHVSLMIDSGIDIERTKYESIGWIRRVDLEVDLATGRSERSPRAVAVMTEMDAVSTVKASFDRFMEDGTRAGFIHAALATEDDVVCMARDVESAAATQKVLGWAVSTDADCSASMLVVRGIIDDQLVEAASRAGIPIVVTDAVPTADAIAVAERSCTTIFGLALSHRRGLFADGGHIGDDSEGGSDAIAHNSG